MHFLKIHKKLSCMTLKLHSSSIELNTLKNLEIKSNPNTHKYKTLYGRRPRALQRKYSQQQHQNKNAHFNTWLSTFPFSVCAWIFLLLLLYVQKYNF